MENKLNQWLQYNVLWKKHIVERKVVNEWPSQCDYNSMYLVAHAKRLLAQKKSAIWYLKLFLLCTITNHATSSSPFELYRMQVVMKVGLAVRFAIVTGSYLFFGKLWPFHFFNYKTIYFCSSRVSNVLLHYMSDRVCSCNFESNDIK